MCKLKCFLLLALILNIAAAGHAQLGSQSTYMALSIGRFTVGHDPSTGLWAGIEAVRPLVTNRQGFLHNFQIGAELYMENGSDKVTVYNPTATQFLNDWFIHQSNTGLTASLKYHPLGKFLPGLQISAGPLLVYSVTSAETRAELIHYGPATSIRMSEIESGNKFLTGYRLSAGYDVNLFKHLLVGVRADFLQYHTRDLNSLLGLKAGFIF